MACITYHLSPWGRYTGIEEGVASVEGAFISEDLPEATVTGISLVGDNTVHVKVHLVHRGDTSLFRHNSDTLVVVVKHYDGPEETLFMYGRDDDEVAGRNYTDEFMCLEMRLPMHGMYQVAVAVMDATCSVKGGCMSGRSIMVAGPADLSTIPIEGLDLSHHG